MHDPPYVTDESSSVKRSPAMTKRQAIARASVLLDRTDVIVRKLGPDMERDGGRYTIAVPVRIPPGVAVTAYVRYAYLRILASGHSWQEMIDHLEAMKGATR